MEACGGKQCDGTYENLQPNDGLVVTDDGGDGGDGGDGEGEGGDDEALGPDGALPTL